MRRTVCWLLAPEVPNYEDPFTMMELMHGKLLLLGDDGAVSRRPPAGGRRFRRLAHQLDGAQSVARVPLERHPDVFAFTVERPDRGPLVVLWRDGDLFSGEDEPETIVEWPWPHDDAAAIDVLGVGQTVQHHDGHIRVPVSVTPRVPLGGDVADGKSSVI